MADRESRTRQRLAESEGERIAALRSRLRSGAVPEEAVALSAALGHAPAIAVLGSAAPAGEHLLLPWNLWSRLLRREDWLAIQAAEARAVELSLREGMRELARLKEEEESEFNPDSSILEGIARAEADGEEMLASVARRLAWNGEGAAPKVERVTARRGHFWLMRTSSWVTLGDHYAAFNDSEDLEEVGSRGYQLAHLAKRPDCEIAALLVPRLLGEALDATQSPASPVEYLQHRLASGELSRSALELAAAAGHDAAAELTGVEPVASFPAWLDGLVDLPFPTIRSLVLAIALDTRLHFMNGLLSPGAVTTPPSLLRGDWIHQLRSMFLPAPSADDAWHETWQEERPDRVREVATWLESRAQAAREARNEQLEAYTSNWRFLVERIDEESTSITIRGIARLWEGLDAEFRCDVEETARDSIIHDTLKPVIS